MTAKLKIGNDASYLKINDITDEDKPIRTIKKGGVYIDYCKNLKKVIGIEILGEVKVEYYDDYIKESK